MDLHSSRISLLSVWMMFLWFDCLQTLEGTKCLTLPMWNPWLYWIKGSLPWMLILNLGILLYRGYYTGARRYEFYFRGAKQYFTNERSEWVKYCFCHEKIKFISSSRCVMFFLLYRQNDIDKMIEGKCQNYIIDKLMCEIMENEPLGSRM